MHSAFIGHGTTRRKIIEYIKKNGSARPYDLAHVLGISAQALHAHLRKLLHDQIIVKKGSPPLVFYVLVDQPKNLPNSPSAPLDPAIQKIINENYMDISPEGVISEGVESFVNWTKRTNPSQKLDSLAREYVDIQKKASQFYNSDGLISGIGKIKNIFPETVLNEILYLDFYSLPKFGKTRLGQIVLHGKQSQDVKMIAALAENIRDKFQFIIKKYKIDAWAWAPHSIPRKHPFLTVLKRHLPITLPEIEVVKAYKGSILVAQKSLSRLEERIQNAHETIFVLGKDHRYKRILIVDDALGSGATMNEIALKIKNDSTQFIMGVVLVGSYKGFEVIREV